MLDIVSNKMRTTLQLANIMHSLKWQKHCFASGSCLCLDKIQSGGEHVCL